MEGSPPIHCRMTFFFNFRFYLNDSRKKKIMRAWRRIVGVWEERIIIVCGVILVVFLCGVVTLLYDPKEHHVRSRNDKDDSCEGATREKERKKERKKERGEE